MKENPFKKPVYKPEDQIKAKILTEARELALQEAKERPLRVGETVAHISADFSYQLKDLINNEATVWVPGNASSVRDFPLNELYRPNMLLVIIEHLENDFTGEHFLN
jgi:hypothetical protein